MTRPEIEDIRGVDSGAVLKALLDRRLIKIVGKKEEVGRPILYGTTREFLEFFALEGPERAAHAARVPRAHRRAPGDRREGSAASGAGTVAALSDATFRAKLEAENEASEAALAVLEAAIAGADVTTQIAEEILRPAPEAVPQVPAPPPSADQA